jgi:ParB-like chromosome segregation protein Spo0J
MRDVQFPCLGVRLVPTAKVVANDYNPNRVAAPELDLLEHSIAEDGLTLPIVVYHDTDKDLYVIVDGFHRWRVLTERFKCAEIPVVTIDKNLSERMASTVRHNRARGKHQVDLQASLVRALVERGHTDAEIREHLGMSEEELLRLKQVAGAARLLAGSEYSASYGRDDEPHFPDDVA